MPKKRIEKKKPKAGAIELTEEVLSDVRGGLSRTSRLSSQENSPSLKRGGVLTVNVQKSEFKKAT